MSRTADLEVRADLIRRIQREGWLRRDELLKDGVHPRWLQRLTSEGLIERVRAGVYRSTAAPQITEQTLYDACTAVPTGVVCLTSALAYHELTTANPLAVELAIPAGQWQPKISHPKIRFYRFRPRLMALGLEEVRGEFGMLRIFGRERSICDAFRLKRIVGKDIALEALQTYLRTRARARIDDLFRMARATRTQRQIQPYIEALI